MSVANIGIATWRKINDYLFALGSAEDKPSLLDYMTRNVRDLIPSDIGCGLLDLSQKIVAGVSFDVPASMIRSYNERYNRLVPSIVFGTNGEILIAHDRVRWADYSYSEFYIDFAKPQGIGFGMSALRPPSPFSLVVQRSPFGKGFSVRENTILEILNRHVNNFLSIREKYDNLLKARITTPGNIKCCFPQLSKRETQVAAHLCAGLSAREISSALLIGVRTTETHIAHLYEKLEILNRLEAIRLIQTRLEN